MFYRLLIVASMLLSLFGFGKCSKTIEYSEAVYQLYTEYVSHAFGSSSHVLHEVVTEPGDIHVDIVWIEPGEGHDYHTLLTMNVGEFKMRTPSNVPNRMELVIRLPKEWDLRSNEEKYSWPITLLKVLARYPLYCKSYLADGHTFGMEELGRYAEGVPFYSSILSQSTTLQGTPASLQLGRRKNVVFYDVIPLYDNELECCFEKGSEALLSLMEKAGYLSQPVINIARKNFCE